MPLVVATQPTPWHNQLPNPPIMGLGAGARLGPYEIRSPLGSGGMGEMPFEDR
jgi:hypothetical protein